MILIDYSEITAILTVSQLIPPFQEKNWLQIHNLLFHILMYVEERIIPELLTSFGVDKGLISTMDDRILSYVVRESDWHPR